MKFIGIFFLTILLVSVCASTRADTPENSSIDPELLLKGHPTISELASTERVTGTELFTLSSEMREYLDRVAIGRRPVERLNSVLRDMKQNGFELRYDLNKTASASEAFAEQRGNCVSFAAMIVSMARFLGVEARLNQAVLPANRKVAASEDGQGYVQNVLHINAVIISDGKPYVIEQGFKIFAGKYLTQLDDSDAHAIYLNNLAMEAMARNELGDAFHYSREAIRLNTDASYLWNSLGTVYRRAGHLRLAEMSFMQALELNSDDKMAKRNLIRVHRAMQKPINDNPEGTQASKA